jgi:drug/metabolite transporter (DMT)-like permease
MSENQSSAEKERRSSIANEEQREQAMEEIKQRFLALPFDTKITLVNWCKEFVNNERRGSVPFNLEEDYLNSIARKQSILQSMMHIAPLLPKFVILAIVVSTICSSLVIPFFKILICDSPYLPMSWRAVVNVVFCLPFMIKEMRIHGDGVKKLFSTKNVLTILLCQVFGVLQGACQLLALRITYSSHVLLFSGMASVVLFFWKIVKRLPITSLEILGIIIALTGAAIISKGSSGGGGYSANDIVMGDLIAFLGSVFGAFNLQILAPLLQFYQTGIYIVLSNVCVIFLGVIATLLSGFPLSPGFDPNTGLFGFLHPK